MILTPTRGRGEDAADNGRETWVAASTTQTTAFTSRTSSASSQYSKVEFRGRLFDNDRLRRQKLYLDNGSDLGDQRLWRQDESEREAAFQVRRR